VGRQKSATQGDEIGYVVQIQAFRIERDLPVLDKAPRPRTWLRV